MVTLGLGSPCCPFHNLADGISMHFLAFWDAFSEARPNGSSFCDARQVS